MSTSTPLSSGRARPTRRDLSSARCWRNRWWWRYSAVSLKALAGETFIIQGSRHGLGLHAATVAACHAAGFTPRVGQEAPRLASTLNLVAVGLGISFVPASLQRMNVDGVVYRRLKGPAQPKAPLHLASRRGAPSAAVQQFLNLVKRAAKGFSAD